MTELEEIIKALCEALPDVFEWNGTDPDCLIVGFVGTDDGVWRMGLELYSPVIAQRALQWAAQAEPLPVINIHPSVLPNDPGPFSIDIMSNKVRKRTAHYFYDFVDLTDEPEARMKVVTEYALLLKGVEQ